ncbi:Wzz/FepE/Etk N-terminal domain-containing protein [Alteromonadaceae bacterium BrNp21-10]|nr:Wzz/FepE/Etk N-terminal domain-containing protein [Alteromonadaceae bacterium BrNp21-10]
MESTNTNSNHSFFDILWQGKWIIIVITALFASLSIVVALNIPNQYKAEVLLAPADNQSSGGLSGLASQMGGIASLAGISLGSTESNDVGEALALLTSRAFLQDFIEKRQLLPNLLAIQSWDEENEKLIYEPSLYDVELKKWVRNPPKNKKVEPTPWEGYSKLISMLEIGEKSTNGTFSISIETLSPTLSMTWAEWLVEDINSTIANRELEEAKQSVEFLHRQLAQTQVAELRSIFYSLIEEQTKKILLGEVRHGYVLKILAPAVFPEERSSPSRGLIVIGLTFLGIILSLIVVLFQFLFFAHEKN